MDLFPEIGLEENKFDTLPKKYWQEIDRRKQFFEKFAKKKGFDPLVAENWYAVTRGSIVRHKGSKVILSYYSGSVIKALTHLFPDIGIDDTKFHFLATNYWQDAAVRRRLFERYAKKKGFDPLVPENWYPITRSALFSRKNAKIILKAHSNSLIKALVQLFPEIGLDESKFLISPRNFWKDKTRRRQFFERYAKRRGFDPLIPENWYNVSRLDVTAKRGRTLLGYYSGSVVKALLDLFPEVNWEDARFKSVPKNHWLEEENLRRFFSSFAKCYDFNPLVPENWYSVAPAILGHKKSRTILHRFRGNIGDALIHFYPNIGLEREQFAFTPSYWQDLDTRRNFFENFAKRNNFDPLVPDNWYTVSAQNIHNTHGSDAVLRYYEGSIARALMELFPDIGLDRAKFTVPSNFWQNTANRRKFFVDFAKIHRFDPLIVENWYAISRNSVIAHKGAETVLQYHSGSLPNALTDLFPELDLDEMKFTNVNKGHYWQDASNRKRFFIGFAKTRGFDPLVPSNWYPIKRREIYAHEGGKVVLVYYSGSVVKALLQLFPDIGLDETKFIRVPQRYWNDLDNRRKFFVQFATDNGFDPFLLKNWEQMPLEDILKVKGANSVLFNYNGNVKKALTDLFPNIG